MSSSSFRTYSIHLSLFLITFFTTTLAGVQWLNRDLFDLGNFHLGLPYSLSLLAVLAAHEFGHYFTARYYNVNVTLPFFIPVPPFLVNPFGTMGAVIRIRSPLEQRRVLFDVGIAGPIAGLVVTICILAYGFTHLPARDYLYTMHPNYALLESIPENGFTLGNSLLFAGLNVIASANNFVPPMNEIYHYPYLCVGWFGLFVTALNLIPIGQLDGGHVLYALVGSRVQGILARLFFGALIVVGLASFVPFSGIRLHLGTTGWLVWAVILYFFIKLDHPEVPDPTPLSPGRKRLGWLIMAIFVVSFPPIPFLS